MQTRVTELLLSGRKVTKSTPRADNPGAVFDDFLERLRRVRVLDPACGSGLALSGVQPRRCSSTRSMSITPSSPSTDANSAALARSSKLTPQSGGWASTWRRLVPSDSSTSWIRARAAAGSDAQQTRSDQGTERRAMLASDLSWFATNARICLAAAMEHPWMSAVGSHDGAQGTGSGSTGRPL